MIHSLLGIMYDGTDRGRGVPDSAAAPINYTRGSSDTVRLAVINNAGVPADLTRAVLTLTVAENTARACPDTPVYSAQATLTNAKAGLCEFVVASTSFRDYLPGRYVYDVALVVGGQRYEVVPLSIFYVAPSTAFI